jgi:hypothetical protein
MGVAPNSIIGRMIVVILYGLLLTAVYVIAPAVYTTVQPSFAEMVTCDIVLATIVATISIMNFNGMIFPTPVVHTTDAP